METKRFDGAWGRTTETSTITQSNTRYVFKLSRAMFKTCVFLLPSSQELLVTGVIGEGISG